ncbi:MAG: hypothetical protein KUL83_12535 [Lentimicrobium sp.]|nr:hypothetical protein [Lentimicrobium sp.]
MMKNLIHTGYLIALIFTGIFSAGAQSAGTRPFRLDMQFGGRMIHRELQPLTENPDFLNYLNGGNGNSAYGVLRLGFSFTPNDRWTFDAGLGMFSDLFSSQLNVQATRNIKAISSSWGWGMMAGFEIYPQYLDEYNQFHIQKDVDMIGDLDKNYRQHTLYDLGISLRPFLCYTGEKLIFSFSTGAGLNVFKPFEVLIVQKKPLGNLRREISYETDFKPVLTSHSGAEFSYTFYRGEAVSLGILAKAEVLFGFRNLTYTRTILTWTADNAHCETIYPDKTIYSKADITGGVFVKF